VIDDRVRFGVYSGPQHATFEGCAELWRRIEASGNICPLTPLENHFRDLAGQSSYGEGFVTHYLGSIIYPVGLTRGTQFLIMGVLIVVNLVGYALVIRKRHGAG